MNINILGIISLACWVIIFIYWVIRSKSRGILNEIVGLMKLICSGLILFIPAFIPFSFLEYKHFLVVQIIGLSINFLGFIICIMAREFLALNWSGKIAIQEKHKLIKNGPYKKIRHPIYSGILVMMLGSSIIMGNLFDFIWMFFCLFGLYRKSKQEETLLIKEFDEEYEQYKKESKMLIPYIL